MITFRREKTKEKCKIFETCVITSFIRSGEITFHSCATVGLVPTVGPFPSQANCTAPPPQPPQRSACQAAVCKQLELPV